MSLLFALLTLIALSLAALALVRSVDTGALVLGNLSFKQDATIAADQATNSAIAYLKAAASLDVSSPSSGYYASAHTTADVTGNQGSDAARELVAWTAGCNYGTAAGGQCTLSPSNEFSVNDKTARFVVFRLCEQEGSATAVGNSCIRPLKVGTSQTTRRGGIDSAHPEPLTADVTVVYYRIVVRVVGARNTTSYVETIVNL